MECSGVLIIEDEQEIRDTLRELFEFEGYKVLTAENGAEGLRMLQEIRRPCIILLDILMPVMNGWEFLEARQRNQELASIPVAILSGIAEKPDSIPGVTFFFRKPVNFERLLKLVDEQREAQAGER